MNSGYLKKIAVLLVAVLLTGLCAGLALAVEVKNPAVGDYLIGPGDVLDIAVWKNADLTKMVTVLPDGKISFPLVGPMTAADKTVSQLSTELRDRLTRYVPDVDLSIIVVKVNSMIIYVIGRVNDPGRFELNTNVTVMQALAMAGGLNPFAKKGDIKVFRKGLADPGYFKFDYDDVSTGVNLAQDIWLKRGDLIVVP